MIDTSNAYDNVRIALRNLTSKTTEQTYFTVEEIAAEAGVDTRTTHQHLATLVCFPQYLTRRHNGAPTYCYQAWMDAKKKA